MSDMVTCDGCGKDCHRTARTCPHCGMSRLQGKRYKSKTTAAVVAILIGGLGIHRFYLGQWWGIFYLLFFWTWIPGLVSFVEGIVFLFANQERWDEKYNEGIAGAGESSGAATAIIVIVVAFVGVAFLGILAAIAIPAYQDYTIRARVSQAIGHAQTASVSIEQYIRANRTMPRSLREAGFNNQPPQGVGRVELNDEEGMIVVTMSNGPIEGKAFGLRLARSGDSMTWQCESVDMPDRYLPSACRRGRQ